MALNITIDHGEVHLAYYPEFIGSDVYVKGLKERGNARIYNTFFVSSDNLIGVDGENVLFTIGKVDGNYNRIFSDVLRTKRDYCFSQDICLVKADFVGIRKTSICQLLDGMIDSLQKDVFIDDESIYFDSDNHILYSDFRQFRHSIPHDAELSKYIKMRAAYVFKGIFLKADKVIEEHDKWLSSVEKKIGLGEVQTNVDIKLEELHALDYKKLLEVKRKLEFYIENSNVYKESDFQKAISDILRFVFPKYLYAVREVKYKGFDKYDKQPDFVLVDYNGMIDFLEIKKPSVKLINIRKYRNNYSSSHELSGTVQQIEKYIACIQRCASEWEEKPPKKIAKHIMNHLKLKVVNPQGIIVMGDARGFNVEQRQDFELIKRQYKNVAEIITYDDLVRRLDNMILALKVYSKQSDINKDLSDDKSIIFR